MSLRDQMARVLAARAGAPTPEAEPPAVERVPFEPGLPHFTENGHGGWVLTPYALAHCIVCGAELPEGVSGECRECRRKIDATVMPWETR